MENARHSNLLAGWAIAAFALIGLLWSMSDTFSAMVGIWLSSSNFTHCILIPPASAILIWRRRHRLERIQPHPSVTGVFLFACCAAVWSLGALGHVSTLQNMAAVAMLGAAVWAVLGRAVATEIAFPLVYLFFMVPFGEFLMPFLMELTADLTVVAARLSGVSVYKDGLFFIIPNGSFKIVEACSGIRMLIASVAVGVLFAHLAFASWIRRLIFVVAMILVSLLANTIRAYLVVMIGYLTGMETIASHVTLGYFVFGFVILAMLLIGSRFADFDHDEFDSLPEAPAADTGSLWPSVIAAALVCAIAVMTPAAVSGIEARAAGRPGPPPLLLPPAKGIWSGPRKVRADWSPKFIGYDTMQSGTYRQGANRVDAFMLSYARQQQGAELINARNRIFNPQRWTQIRESVEQARFVDGRSMNYLEMELRSADGYKRLVRYWYIVDELSLHRPVEIKLRELKNSILGQSTPATLVAISFRFGEDREAAERTLDAFMREVYAEAYPLYAGGSR